MDDRQLKDQARALRPVMAIGKNGVTQGAMQLLQRELEQKRLVKVKLLKGFVEGRDRKEEARRLAAFAQARLVQVVGNVVVLYK